MSLLKRRSRSETRQIDTGKRYSNLVNRREVLLAPVNTNSEAPHLRHSSDHFSGGGSDRRKTSAELISEAKNSLMGLSLTPSGDISHQAGRRDLTPADGGVRLVSTRRPITPREPGRALYGKVALPGRPPSAFSLSYLQKESQRAPATPALEPIPHSDYEQQQQISRNISRRSQSLDLGSAMPGVSRSAPRRLPALEIKGVAMSGKHSTEIDSPKEKPLAADDSASGVGINVLTSRKLLQRNSHLLAQTPTQQLIEMLKEHAGLKDCTEETVNHIYSILNELYARVYKTEKSQKRASILGGLYGLVECSSPKILLAVARVVLALRVTGSNLTGACKLIFKVARNELNDPLFHDNNVLELLIDGLGRASPLEDPEACIYGYGSIRFLTSSAGQERTTDIAKDSTKDTDLLRLPPKPATAPAPNTTSTPLKSHESLEKLMSSTQCTMPERLARYGAVELMVLHLQILNEVGATQKLSGPPLHSLYQLSATLRALADASKKSEPSGSKNLKLEQACPHLVRAAEVATGELEVQANIVRTLSVLSEDMVCCYVLANFTARIGMLLGPCCEIFNHSSEKLLTLLSRLGYILGNIMARFDNARIQFYHNDVAMQYLLSVLELYSKQSFTLHNALGDTCIDVLIKMVRVVANMTVNAEVGIGLGSVSNLGTITVRLLNTILHIAATQPQMKEDLLELWRATLGSLHNLCFYQDKSATPSQVLPAHGSLQSILPELTAVLYKTLQTSKDPHAHLESARVMGNLTRNAEARRHFINLNGLAHIVHLLNSTKTCYHLRSAAVGILVNLLGDHQSRATFMQHKGDEVLGNMLREALTSEDVILATTLCQAWWNLLSDAPNQTVSIKEETLETICDVLVYHLDAERMFNDGIRCGDDDDWQAWAVVGRDLLERLQTLYYAESEEETMSSDESDNDEGNVGDENGNGNGQRQINGNGNALINGNGNGFHDNDDDEDDVHIEEM